MTTERTFNGNIYESSHGVYFQSTEGHNFLLEVNNSVAYEHENIISVTDDGTVYPDVNEGSITLEHSWKANSDTNDPVHENVTLHTVEKGESLYVLGNLTAIPYHTFFVFHKETGNVYQVKPTFITTETDYDPVLEEVVENQEGRLKNVATSICKPISKEEMKEICLESDEFYPCLSTSL